MPRWLEALAYTFLWFSLFGWMFGLYFLLEYRDERRMRAPLLADISDLHWDRLRGPLPWRLRSAPETAEAKEATYPPPSEAEVTLLRPTPKRHGGQVVAFPHRLSPRIEPGTVYRSTRRR